MRKSREERWCLDSLLCLKKNIQKMRIRREESGWMDSGLKIHVIHVSPTVTKLDNEITGI